MRDQLKMFPEPAPTADDELNAAQADIRLAQMARADARREHDRQRSRRRRPVRAKTVSVKRMTKRELEVGRLLFPPEEHADIARPKTRAECKDGARPCPFVSCSHHLYLDVSARTGAIKVNFPDVDVDEITESCALDGADRLGMTLEEVGVAMNLTRERVRQIEVKALAKCQATIETRGFRDLVDDRTSTGKRRLPMLLEEDDEQRENDEADTFEGPNEDSVDFSDFASDALDPE